MRIGDCPQPFAPDTYRMDGHNVAASGGEPLPGRWPGGRAEPRNFPQRPAPGAHHSVRRPSRTAQPLLRRNGSQRQFHRSDHACAAARTMLRFPRTIRRDGASRVRLRQQREPIVSDTTGTLVTVNGQSLSDEEAGRRIARLLARQPTLGTELSRPGYPAFPGAQPAQRNSVRVLLGHGRNLA